VADNFAPFHNQVVTIGIEFTPQNLHVKHPAAPDMARARGDHCARRAAHAEAPQSALELAQRRVRAMASF